jgi:acetolactate synthase I/II/III large subunit
MRHAGRVLIEQLEAEGVDTVFCVPGESYLAALDGLYDSNRIRTVVCRQEGGAAMMADGHARMTGKPGVAFVTRGPGATNASIGIHIAQQDSIPLVLFVGLPGRDMEDREAFQEFDLKAVFGSLAKWAEVVNDPKRLPEYVSRAFHIAASGRPGPVVLGLPEDMLALACDVPAQRASRPAEAAPVQADMEELAGLLKRAARPLAIVGGPGWSAAIKARFEDIARKLDLPVACAFRCQDYFDNRHPCYAGHAGIGIDGTLAEAIKSADVLLVIGARLGEMTTSGYTLVAIPEPKQKLIHVHPSADELGRVYRAELPVCASSGAFVDALARLAPVRNPAWAERTAALHAAYDAYRKPQPTPGALKLELVIANLEDMLPEDAIVANGAGNYAAFTNRYYVYKQFRTQLGPTCGAMGYGLPAAIAAKLAEPQRTVVAMAGDGCFLMNGQELATAVQYGANVIILVANNGMYGTIRMHQEREYPGRVMATSLVNPDFAALARSYGAFGETVTDTEQFRGAFARAVESGRPALLDLKLDPEALSPKMTLTQVRAAGERAQKS